MSQEQLEELGPIDYVVLEWLGKQPDAGGLGRLWSASLIVAPLGCLPCGRG